MFFEVTVSNSKQATITSLQVDARSWRSAFMTASAHAGGSPPDLSRAIVHIDGKLITVFDGGQNRAVTVRQLAENEARLSQLVKAQTGAHAAITGPPPAHAEPARPVGFTDRATGSFRAISGVLVANAPAANSDEGRILSAIQSSAAPAPAAKNDAPWIAPSHSIPSSAVVADDSSSALEDIFLESPAIIDDAPTLDDAAEKLLALAMSKVACEMGAIFLSEQAGQPLVCCCAAGKNAKKVQSIGIPFDGGIASATLQTGLVISLANPRGDSRYTPEFASIGFDEKNVVYAPVTGERAYGVVVFLNRTGKPSFSPGDASALAYIGKQFGEYIQRQLDAQAL
jgi:hypothetical protein